MKSTNPTYQELKDRVSELETELEKTKWLHDNENNHNEPYIPLYGDVTELNTERTILDFVGKENLKNLTSELMDLLDTSVAIYEKNGDYAYGVFNSGWCQLLDASSRKLCNTDDNKKALGCGKWLCHEDCWNNSAKAAIISKKSTDIDCIGAIKLYAEPIFAGNEVVGAINIGYGNPPTDDKTLKELSEQFSIDFDELKQKAIDYKTRPDFIIETSKKRLKSIAKLIGEIINQKQTENKLQERVKEFNCFSELSKLVETKENIEDILKNVAFVLKKSFQFPEITEVRISNKDFLYQTDNFRETEWIVSSDIVVEHKLNGKIEIAYLENKTQNADPFLKEEYSLLDIISERVGKIIERLQKSEKYAVLFDTLFEAILQADKNGIITEANQEAATLCGYNTPKELIGKPMTDLYTKPEMRSEIVKKLKDEGGVFQNFEFLLKKKDAAVIPTLCNIRMLFNRKGEFVGTLGALRDITDKKQIEQALKESKEKYKRLINNSNALIIEADADSFEIITCNPAMAKTLKKEVHEIIGKKITGFLPPEIVKQRVEHGEKALSENKIVQFEDERNGRYFVTTFIPYLADNRRFIQALSYDITDRKKAEQKLKESEQKANALLRAIPDMMFRLDKTGVYLDYKASHSDLYIQDVESIVGLKNRDVAPKPFADLVDKYISKTLESNEIQIFEYELDIPNKGLRQFEARMVPIGIEEVTVISRDITEQKQAEQKILEYQKYLKKSQEIGSIGTWSRNLKNGEMIWTDETYKIFGLKKGSRLNIEIYTNCVHPDDREFLEREWQKGLKNNSFEIQHRIIVDNSIKWVKEKAEFLFDFHGEAIEAIGVTQDITEQKQAEQALKESEEKYRLLSENTSDGVALFENGKINYISPAYAKMFGISIEKLSKINFDEIFSFIHPEDREFIRNKINEARKNKTENYRYEYRVKKSTGEYIWVEDSLNSQYDENGKHIRTIIRAREITDRKKAEHEIQAYNKQLQIANKQKDTFLQILAHDLRSPFNSLIGFSELLMKNLHKYDIDKIEKQVGYIYEIAGKTYNMLNDLLLWAKAQANKLSVNPEPHDIKDILTAEIKMLEAMANQKNIIINNHLPDNLMVTFDADMIKTVIRNLVSNAIKFTPGGGQIAISTEKQKEQVIVKVADTGVGIPEKKLNNLWENSELNSTEGTAGEKGTGFGLLLCKEFIEKHGGKIWAESEIGKGSVFSFSIPCKG